MAFAVVAIALFALIDFAIMAVLSRFRTFSSFTLPECAIAPFAVFFVSGILLRLFGYAVAPWPAMTGTYFLVACVLFFQIEIQGEGTDATPNVLKRSVLTAFVFSILHFVIQYSFALLNLR